MSDQLSQYAHPDVLVSTQWVQDHRDDPSIRIIESNEDVLLYDTGHIPGAVHIDWRGDLQDDLIRDYISPEHFAEVCRKNGIGPVTTCVFYGDKANWWACYALWTFRLFGHVQVKVMDGGRDKWVAEGRELTREKPEVTPVDYPTPDYRHDEEIRAFYADTLLHSNTQLPLIDVRSPGEFSGEITHMPEYPQEGVLRGGHIPGAKSVPWKEAVNQDGTFKSFDALVSLYQEANNIQKDDDVIVYCRIGERSSHTWFVLTYLLGYEKVRNYDGSWTEWGNMVRAPIERD
jgi:thiosulfate/3-mercaptopyruvate sulfurtransferase